MKLSDLNKPLTLNLSPGPKDVDPSILRHKPIPHVLAYKNPRTFFGQAWWDEVRREVYRSNNWCCQACGDCDNLPLEAHEMFEYEAVPDAFSLKELKATFTRIVPLCHKCHQYIHSKTLAQSTRIRRHNRGNKLLLKAGLPVPQWKAVTSTVEVPKGKQDDFNLTKVFRHVNYLSWVLDLSRLELTEEMEKELEKEVLCIID